MAKIPKLKSEKEDREFWDTQDSTEYWEDTQHVQPFKLSEGLKKQIQEKKKNKRLLTLRIGQEEIVQAKKMAEEKGIGYQTLMRMWIIEGLKRERQINITI